MTLHVYWLLLTAIVILVIQYKQFLTVKHKQYLGHHAVDHLRRDLARVFCRLHQLILSFLPKMVR